VVQIGWAALRCRPGAALALAGLIAIAAAMPLALAICVGQLVNALNREPAGYALLPVAGPLVAALVVVFLFQQIVAPAAQAVAESLGRTLNQVVADRVMSALRQPTEVSRVEGSQTRALLAEINGGLVGATTRDALVGLVNIGMIRCAAGAGALLLFFYHWWLSIPLLAIYIFATSMVSRHYQLALRAGEGMTDRTRRAVYLKDMLSTAVTAKDVRVFDLRDWVRARYQGEAVRALAAGRQARGGALRIGIYSALAVTVAQLPVYLLLARDLEQGAITVGAFVMFAIAAAELLNINVVSPDLVNISAGGHVLAKVTELETWLAEPVTTTRPVTPPTGAIVFENVGFRYPDASSWTLRGLDLTLPIGSSTAIVGVNGAGKTTLVKLMSGLYSPTEGRILVDGTDLRELDRAEWQRQFATLFQDWIRWGVSVRDNVALGAPHHEFSQSELDDIAVGCGLVEVIDRLPDGWLTVLKREFDGVDLSGGQWQRVGLARALAALAGGASVLMLDEPTAALDVRGEAELYDTLLEAANGRTVVLISHRLSTVRHADRIVVLADGSVREMGGHEELLSADGPYARMFAAQAKYFNHDVEVR